jgi:hypothetical protein
VKKAEARRREKEKREGRAKELEHRGRATARATEAGRREQEVRDERLRKEEEQWLLEHLERSIPEVGERRKERAQEIREDVVEPQAQGRVGENQQVFRGVGVVAAGL